MSIMHDSQGRGIGESNPLPIKQLASDIVVPVDIQARLAQTIQTHNAVSVAASGTSIQSSWMDCDGFDKIACTLLMDASVSGFAYLLWSNDGTAQHGFETIITSNGNATKTGIADVKARYAKIQIGNGDAAAHTMSAWAYLKA